MQEGERSETYRDDVAVEPGILIAAGEEVTDGIEEQQDLGIHGGESRRNREGFRNVSALDGRSRREARSKLRSSMDLLTEGKI